MKGLSWQQILEESPLEWLLEESNPSVRYFTLRDLLGKDQRDSEVAAAKVAISNSRPTTKILAKQHPEGYWEEQFSPYLPKYKSSYWQIMTLGQLGIDKTDERVRKACELIFQFQHEEGGFSSSTLQGAPKEYEWLRARGKKLPPLSEWASVNVYESQYSCLTGNMVAALTRLGYVDDVRVKRALRWLVNIQNRDGGWLCPYWKAHIKDTHSCFYGTICPLEAFSELPRAKLTSETRQTVEKSAEFLLMHHLFKADHHGYKIINPSWLRFGFPWFYGYNILRGLDVLIRLGYVDDERLSDAVEILLQKRQKDGTWILESTPSRRMHTTLEPKGKPSKWITLIALRVLKKLSTEAN